LALSDNVINPFTHTEFHENSSMQVATPVKADPKVSPQGAFPSILSN